MSIITRGFASNTLITQGYGGTLVVVVTSGGGSFPYRKVYEPEEGVIQTKRIKLPGTKTTITVDVLLIQYTEDLSVEATLEKYADQYENIQVYLEKDVELYD